MQTQTIRTPTIYYRYLYNRKYLSTKLLTKNIITMSEKVVKTTNWVAIVTIIANAVVELIKLIFS